MNAKTKRKYDQLMTISLDSWNSIINLISNLT